MCNSIPNVGHLIESTGKGVIKDAGDLVKTGVHYAVFEYIDGTDLFDFIARNTLTMSQT